MIVVFVHYKIKIMFACWSASCCRKYHDKQPDVLPFALLATIPLNCYLSIGEVWESYWWTGCCFFLSIRLQKLIALSNRKNDDTHDKTNQFDNVVRQICGSCSGRTIIRLMSDVRPVSAGVSIKSAFKHQERLTIKLQSACEAEVFLQ